MNNCVKSTNKQHDHFSGVELQCQLWLQSQAGPSCLRKQIKHFSFESRQQWADADTLDGFPVYAEDALRLTLLQSILVISQDDDGCEY